MLAGHLAYGQVELAKRYTWQHAPPASSPTPPAEGAAEALGAAVKARDLAGVRAALSAGKGRPRFVEEAGRTLLRCGLEAAGPLAHRFTLAEAARRLAAQLDPAGSAAALEAAALSIAHGYPGARAVAGLRDLPQPRPGSTDYAGRLLVGVTANRRPEAHAALRGFFEVGTSPRQVALAFIASAGHFDTNDLHTDHPFMVLQAAWRAVSDGFFASDALPLFVELANRLCEAEMDHELIQQVEESLDHARDTA
jgi:hypothetical protein